MLETGKEPTTRQVDVGIAVPPDIVLENARIAAKALVDVLSKKKNPVIMNNEQYLEYEDWQTCGQFYGYTVKTGEAVAVEIDGVKGAKAHADLINFRTGEIVGGAEAYCMRDEEKWNTRPKYEWQDDPETGERKRTKVGDEVVPWFQLASMAQTRAGAKAFRNRLAWVVVLAGYRPTPAEEMTESTAARGEEHHARPHWCSQHKTGWFKKGKMRGYAHPLEGTDQWCSEPEKPASAAKAEAPATKPTIAEEVKDVYPHDAMKPPDKVAPPLKNANPAASAPAAGVIFATPGPSKPSIAPVAPEDMLFSDDDYSGVAAALSPYHITVADVLAEGKKRDIAFKGFKIAQEAWDMAQKMPGFKK